MPNPFSKSKSARAPAPKAKTKLGRSSSAPARRSGTAGPVDSRALQEARRKLETAWKTRSKRKAFEKAFSREGMTSRDFQKAVKKHFSVTLSSSELTAVCSAADVDGSGLVDYSEFLKIVEPEVAAARAIETDADLRRAAEKIARNLQEKLRTDKDARRFDRLFSDGALGADELLEVLKSPPYSVSISRAQADAVLVYLDANGDGVVSRDEFYGLVEAGSNADAGVAGAGAAANVPPPGREFKAAQRKVVAASNHLSATKRTKMEAAVPSRGLRDAKLGSFLSTHLGVRLSSAELEALRAQLDLDGNGTLDKAELLAVLDNEPPAGAANAGASAGKGSSSSSSSSSKKKEALEAAELRVQRAYVKLSSSQQRALQNDFDEDGINEQEFENLLSNHLNLRLHRPELKALLRSLDTDRSGQLDKEEFLGVLDSAKTATSRPRPAAAVAGHGHGHRSTEPSRVLLSAERKLQAAIEHSAKSVKARRSIEKAFEPDDSLDREEFEQLLDELRCSLSRAETDALVARLDADGNGGISLEEFKDIAYGLVNDEEDGIPKHVAAARGGGGAHGPLARDIRPEDRVNAWLGTVSKHRLVTLTGAAVPTQSTTATFYCIDFKKVTAWHTPRAMGADARFAVRVTFYHTTTGTAFGMTWVSKEVEARRGGRSGAATVELNQPVYFYSHISDESVAALVELVAVAIDPERGVADAHVSCGWSSLRPFSHRSLPDLSQRGSTPETSTLTVHQGSVRNALAMDPGMWSQAPQHAEMKLHVEFGQVTALAKMQHLVPQHYMFGPWDAIPGLQLTDVEGARAQQPVLNANAADHSVAIKPRLATTTPVRLRNLSVNIPNRGTFEREMLVVMTARHNLGKNAQAKIVQRSLRVTVHNSIDQTLSTGSASLALAVQGDEDMMTAPGSTKLPGYVRDRNYALVFSLEYTLHWSNVHTAGAAGGDSSRHHQTMARVNANSKICAGVHVLLPYDGESMTLDDFVRPGRDDNCVQLPLTVQENLRILTGTFIYLGGSQYGPSEFFIDTELVIKPRGAADSDSDTDSDSDSGSRRRHRHRASDDDDDDDEEVDERSRKPKKKKKKHVRIASSSDSDSDSDLEDRIARAREKAKRKQLLRDLERGAALDEPRPFSLEPSPEDWEGWRHGVRPPADQTSLLAHSLNLRLGADQGRAVIGDAASDAVLAPQGVAGSVSELSRASRTRLSRHGFTDVIEDSVADRRVTGASSGRRPEAEVSLELEDQMRSNEIVLQFAAFRTVLGDNVPVPEAVRFTFKFYSCAPTRTEVMVLHPPEGSANDRRDMMAVEDSVTISDAHMLVREERHGRSEPSLAYKFVVDTSAAGPDEGRNFAEYLARKTLFVDAWDADSLLHLGSFAVPLHVLMRQGRPVVKAGLEYDVVSAAQLDAGAADQHVVVEDALRGVLVGKVQVLLANYGLAGEGPAHGAGEESSSGGGPGAEPNWRMYGRGSRAPLAPESGDAALLLGGKRPKLRVRARPLMDADQELANKLRASRDRRNHSGRSGGRAVADDRSLTAEEFEGLARRFKARPGRVKYEGRMMHLLHTINMNQLERKLMEVLQRAEAKGITARDAFASFDRDGDGEITLSEFERGLRVLGFVDIKPNELRALVNHFDKDGDGGVSVDEFVRFVDKNRGGRSGSGPEGGVVARVREILKRAHDKGVRFEDAFAHLDRDGDGEITADELARGLGDLGVRLSAAETRALVRECDRDSSGTVSVQEFLNFASGGRATAASGAADLKDRVREIFRRAHARGLRFEDAFAHFDKDGSGDVSVRELTSGLRAMGLNFTDPEARVLVQELDTDGDGEINVQEFLRFARGGGGGGGGASGAQENDTHRRVRQILLRAQSKGVELEQAFRHFDTDNSGEITAAEFQEGLLALKLDLSNDEARSLVQRLDTDGDGNISITEFVTFVQAGSAPSSASGSASSVENRIRQVLQRAEAKGVQLEQAFRHFDADDSGEITAAEFRRGLETLNIELNDDEARTLVQHLDRDGDGKISITEFVTFARAPVTSTASAPSSSSSSSSSAGRRSDGRERVDAKALEQRLRSTLAAAKRKGVSVERAFAHLDTNGDGSLTVAEFRSGLLSLGVETTDAEARSLCAKFDADDNGRVSLREFMAFSRRPSKEESESRSQGYMATEYVFSSDPATLRAEQVVRRAAEAAARAGMNLYGKFKQLDDDDSGTVLKGDFVQILMDLGLSIMDAPTGEVIRTGNQGAEVTERQLRRLENLRGRQLGRTKKFHGFDDELQQAEAEMRVIKDYRNGHKKQLVQQLLQQSVTTKMHLFASYGRVCFFEFPFTNPYGHEERFSIRCEDAEMRVVTNSDEWWHLRSHVSPAWGEVGTGPVEAELIGPEMELSLRAGETVRVPFTFLTFTQPRTRGEKHRVVPITFVSESHGHTVHVVNSTVHLRPHLVDRTFRFASCEGEIMKRSIRFHPSAEFAAGASGNGAAQPAGGRRRRALVHNNSEFEMATSAKFIHCADRNVVVEWKNVRGPADPQEVFLRFRVGAAPDISDFYLLLYDDEYHASLHEVWHVCVQAMHRADVNATMGQATQAHIMVKGDRFSRRVACFSSHPKEIAFVPDRPFQLVSGACNKVGVRFSATSAGRKNVRVHMVDVDNHELVGAWLLTANASPPLVTKTFDVELPVGRQANKKIAYTNQWDHTRTYHLRSSDDAVMKVRYPQLEVPAGTQAYIRVWFAAVPRPMTKDVFLFVNDERDQNEECLLVRATFV